MSVQIQFCSSVACVRDCASNMIAYSKLAKLNHLTGEYEVFFPLRAVGLAYELGHKLALGKKGCYPTGRSGFSEDALAINRQAFSMTNLTTTVAT